LCIFFTRNEDITDSVGRAW